ncbi:unnamed protein product, partial [Cyprideis torosa]
MQHRSHAGKNPRQYGENLFWASPLSWSDGRVEPQQISAAEVANEWAIEAQHYDYGSNSCRPGEQCGHYTQMVWRDTRQVGCAMTLCPDQGQIWVSQLEMLSVIERRLQTSDIEALKKKVGSLSDKVP